RAGRLARTRLHAVQDDRGPAPDPAARVPASGAGRRALGVAVSVVVGRTRPGAVAGRVSLAVLVPGVRVVPVAVPVDGTGAGRGGGGGGGGGRGGGAPAGGPAVAGPAGAPGPEPGQRPAGTHRHPVRAAGEHARRVPSGRADQGTPGDDLGRRAARRDPAG